MIDEMDTRPTLTEVALWVNGQQQTITVPTDETLLKTLRREFGLGSVRGTCGIGICGTCTVLVDGLPVSSCLSLTVMNRGRDILTSEGLVSGNGELDPVQTAFVKYSAFQCSYCIPAIVLTVRSLIDSQPEVDLEGVREQLGGNLCRCGSYPQILEAVEELLATRGDGKAGTL